MTTFPWSFRGLVTPFRPIPGQEPKPWSGIAHGGKTWKARTSCIRSALDRAAGGTTPAVEDVADALMAALEL